MLDQLLLKAVNKAPSIARVPLKVLPFELYRRPLQYVLQKLLAEQLADGELDVLENRWLHIHVSDIELKFAVSVEDESVRVAATDEQQADVTFAGNSQDLLLVAARKQDPDTLFFRRKLSISGDTELGLAVKNIMDAVDWEQLPTLATKALEQSATLVERARQVEAQKAESAPLTNETA